MRNFLVVFIFFITLLTSFHLGGQINYTTSKAHFLDKQQAGFLLKKHHSFFRDVNNTTSLNGAEIATLDSSNFSNKKISINPVLTSRNWYNATSASFSSHNLLGVSAKSSLFKNKLSISTALYGGKSSFPNYIDSLVRPQTILPNYTIGYGKNNNYSFQDYLFAISYSPSSIFNFEIGRGKHFMGDGYRSLFLSDYSSPYNYGKITAEVANLKYQVLYSWLKDASMYDGSRKSLQNKYATFHTLNWNVCRKFSVSLFESIIWQGTDSNRHRGFDVNYLNPVLFFRPTEYSLGSSDNAFIGAAFKATPLKNQVLYGQLVLDEFLLSAYRERNGWWGNKYGIQLGFKSYDLFTLKNLFFTTEVNTVRPYTYTHGSVQQNYSHLGMALAHPMGANFIESVTFLSYKINKLQFMAQAIAAKYGKDLPTINYGKNIFLSYTTRRADFGNVLLQGVQTNFYYLSLSSSYLVLPKQNISIQLGAAYRQEGATKNLFATFSLFTPLFNFYEDQ
ncbi:MAG: hypothetical protein J0M08_05020 [Bacteroidetes bacterium]|nr:hypothetical protein [Bacteroidota bacterium]